MPKHRVLAKIGLRMTTVSKHKYRVPKQQRGRERFEDVLEVAKQYVENGKLETFTLVDILNDVDITVGSLYHFFPSKEALLVALTHRAHDEFEKGLQKSVHRPAENWQEFLKQAVTATRDIYMSAKFARIMILGPGYIWPVRLADSARNASAATQLMQVLSSRFDFPSDERMEARLYQAIVLMDAIFRTSYETMELITDEHLELVRETFVLFIQQYFAS